MKAQELRNKSVDELQGMLKGLGEQRFKLNMKKSMSEVKQPHLLIQVKKDIARISTIINEKRSEGHE